MSRGRLVVPDVNVWLATVSEAHPSHASATRWWRERALPSGLRVAFCRLTQLGLLRLLTNGAVMGAQRRTTAQAWSDYQAALTQDAVCFASEPPRLDEVLGSLCTPRRSSTDFWTDAYLAAFAMAAEATLVTFDGGFEGITGLDALVLT